MGGDAMSGWDNRAVEDLQAAQGRCDYVTIQERIPIWQAPVMFDEPAEPLEGTIGAIRRTTEPPTWWRSQQWTSTPPATLTWESVPLVMDRNAEINRVYYINTDHHRWYTIPDIDWDNLRPRGWSKEDWECMKVSSGL